MWETIALIYTFFNHQSLLQLIFGRLWKHGSALAIQSNDHSKTLEWQVFSQGWWRLDLPILHLRITFPMYSWCATRNPVPDSTYHLADLKSVTTESRNDSPCMRATPWSRVNWKMYDENSTFACFDAICTQISVTWPHCGTVHDFLAVLTDRACRHESDFWQRDGSDSTCGRRVHAVQNKTPEQTSACFACIYGAP